MRQEILVMREAIRQDNRSFFILDYFISLNFQLYVKISAESDGVFRVNIGHLIKKI